MRMLRRLGGEFGGPAWGVTRDANETFIGHWFIISRSPVG
jgi:hypothetical protein